MKLSGATLIAALGLAALSLAQGGGRGGEAAPGGEQDRGGAKSGTTDDVEVAREYFAICDYDGGGWISFAEASSSLGIDRRAFGLYDVDNDGRITAEEFTNRYVALKARGGAFTAPVPDAQARRAPKRTPKELIEAFDTDKDGTLDEREIGRALEDYRAHGVDSARVLADVDRDGSKKVEAEEAQALLDVLAPPAATEARGPKVGSIAELFDRLEPRRTERDLTPHPARITGPVPTFRRLDFDASGDVSVADLEALQRPLQLPIRIRAVVAALDTDGNGVLSAEEFDAALK